MTTNNILYNGNVASLPHQPKMPLPTRALLFRVQLNGTSGGTELSYRLMTECPVTSARPIDKTVQGVLDGSVNVTWRQPNYEDDTVEHRSNLAIKIKNRSYLVFLLDPGNWRFSRGVAPFKVKDGKEDHYRLANCMFEENGVWNTSALGPSTVDCRIAYFSAYSDGDIGSGQRFLTPFNIYVDVIPATHPERYIPIAIDPDVGYPGGNS